jgi:hypothetical protein
LSTIGGRHTVFPPVAHRFCIRQVVVIAITEFRAYFRNTSAGALAGNEIGQALGSVMPTLKIAVGRENDAVDAFLVEILFGKPVRKTNTLAAAVETACVQAEHRAQDAILFGARRWRQNEARLTGVSHNGHAILRAQLLDEQPERLFLAAAACSGRVHRARAVDQENQIALGRSLSREVETLDTDMEDLRVGIPRARIDGKLSAGKGRPGRAERCSGNRNS